MDDTRMIPGDLDTFGAPVIPDADGIGTKVWVVKSPEGSMFSQAVHNSQKMLILDGRVNVIGDFIRITVIRIDRDTVNIGIEAPKEIHVFRSEIDPRRQSDIEALR